MKRSREIIVGIVVLASVAIFYFGYNYLKGNDIFKQQDYYYAVYNKIAGIAPNAPVQVNGLKVGRVTSTELHPDLSGRIIVQFSIENDRFNFPKNAVAQIMSTDLLGSRAVAILPPPQGQEPLGNAVPGDTINAAIEGDMTQMVQKELEPFKMKLNEMMVEVDTVIQSVQLIFNEDARKALDASFDAIVAGFETFELTAHEIDSLIREERGRIASIIGNVDEITSTLEEHKDDLGNFVQNMSDISDTLKAADIYATIAQADTALVELTALMNRINQGQGTMGALMHDRELYDRLAKATKDLDNLILDFQNNPHRFVHISAIDFHREKKNKKEEKEEEPEE